MVPEGLAIASHLFNLVLRRACLERHIVDPCAMRISISATKCVRSEAPVQSVEEHQRGFTGTF
jgi:hypothetical protein